MSKRYVPGVVVALVVSIFPPAIETLPAQSAPFAAGPFVRGDVNQDGGIDIADAVTILLHLFTPLEAGCEKAADTNDSDAVDISDAIFLLQFLFQAGSEPPAPFELCGWDPTPDALSCERPACSEASIIISEFMASNAQTLVDADDDSSDWMEFHLPLDAPFPIDLGGWYATDDPFNLTKWQFPLGLQISPGEFLVVFASGKDRSDPEQEIHASFRLDRDGGYLALVAPDGKTVIDEYAPSYPRQLADISYGPVRTTTSLIRAGDTFDYHVPSASDAALGDAWTTREFDPAGWQTGATGLGFVGVASAGFSVTRIQASVTVDNLAVADAVLDDPAQQAGAVTEHALFIDYHNGGESGNYPDDLQFPGVEGEDADNFIVHVTGTIVIPEAGTWTFGVNSDEGFRLTVTGAGETFELEHAAPRSPADSLGAFSFPQAGPYLLTLLYYEKTGGAGLELFAAQGLRVFGGFNPDVFRLVGDADGGGLGHLSFAEDIQTDVASLMRDTNASIWMRREFNVEDPAAIGELTLSMKYEDGFVAYLNGREVARRNAPGSPGWSSAALQDRAFADVLVKEWVSLNEHIDKLVAGPNILAIHGLNDSPGDDVFLIAPELQATASIAAMNYMTVPTPGEPNVPGAVDYVRDLVFSVQRRFVSSSFALELHTPTPDTEIRYTLDGSTPRESHGTVYGGSVIITGTTVVRARAFKPQLIPSRVATHTYINVSDVIRQSPSGQRPGPSWPAGSVNGQIIDYGMDPDVVDSAEWAGQVEDGLLAIPTISLATDLANLFDSTTGIYVNASRDGRAWERRTSVELIHPDGSPGFAVDGGLRIRGAFSRRGSNPKHAFRVIFRSQYGADRLQYPLFGGEGVDEFERVDLRTSQNYSWAFQGSSKNTMLRDVFSRDVQRDMLQPYTKSRYYHLYINGHYWGIYQTEERADADFAASYLGGSDDDYDVIKNDSSGSRELHATDGTMDAYRRLYDAAVAGFSSDQAYRRVLGLNADGSPDPEGERLVDPENLMDYMICTYYTGDPDAPVSAWAHFSNNVFATYNHRRRDGFMWFRHDAEHSLGANGGLFEARLLTDDRDRSIGQEWRHFNPAWLHLRLTAHPEYLLQFADRVNRYFFHGGILSGGPNMERWMSRFAQIDRAIVAESARWGDSKTSPPLTKTHWLTESNWLVDIFFPQRTQIVLDQMRSVDMFPDLGLVSFSQHGGEVSPGFALSMTQGNGDAGTIYYTVTGADPRQWGGGVHPDAMAFSGDPITIDSTATVRARLHAGSDWGAMTEARFTVGMRGLVLNEIMAANTSVLEDPEEPGEYPDWIEVFNGTAGTIDLGGLYLTDDLLDLTHWQIPPGVKIDPGEYLVFYADDDGTQGSFHTNFQLSRNGEVVALVDADGTTLIDSVMFNVQTTDVSSGRYPDGNDAWGTLTSATPGAANTPHAP